LQLFSKIQAKIWLTKGKNGQKEPICNQIGGKQSATQP